MLSSGDKVGIKWREGRDTSLSTGGTQRYSGTPGSELVMLGEGRVVPRIEL